MEVPQKTENRTTVSSNTVTSRHIPRINNNSKEKMAALDDGCRVVESGEEEWLQGCLRVPAE